MVRASGAPLPTAPGSIDELRAAAMGCRACDLWERATQTVFGEGAEAAEIMLVGEQPGDREDRAGAPFVGPAGELLDRALKEAGIDRRAAYVTNVVKHFKWRPRGKRRIHERPNTGEIRACHPWFEAEVARVRPRIVVCLGATAAQALIRPDYWVTVEHGRLMPSAFGTMIGATVHPAPVLPALGATRREEAFAGLVADLRAMATSAQLA